MYMLLLFPFPLQSQIVRDNSGTEESSAIISIHLESGQA